MTMNCATQQTARSHPGREPVSLPPPADAGAFGLAGASTLKRAPPSVAMAPSTDDDTRGAAAHGARELAARVDLGALEQGRGLRANRRQRERLPAPASQPPKARIGVGNGCYDRQRVRRTNLSAGTRKLVAATTVGVALAVALAGCGGGNGGKSHHSSTSSTSTSKGSKKKSSTPGY
jgi:hypothetical protein